MGCGIVASVYPKFILICTRLNASSYVLGTLVNVMRLALVLISYQYLLAARVADALSVSQYVTDAIEFTGPTGKR